LQDSFAAHGVEFRIGNMHGNSAHKHPDRNGYGTSFDLFSEIARQPDYPDLSAVPEESAKIIRFNRISLAEHGFSHWGDMPVWSAKLGFVVTNFMTDNRMGRDETYELIVQSETLGAYQIAAKQPPGSRNRAEGKRVPLKDAHQGLIGGPVHGRFRLGEEELRQRLSQAKGVLPLLLLLHPEFYC
jgi:hypothetical protein